MIRSVLSNTESGGTVASLVWAGLPVVILAAYLVSDAAEHPTLLRALLLLTAVGEGMAFVSNSLRPRSFSVHSGRPYDPAYHGVMQDFGFYNLAFALLLVVAAFDPPRYILPIGVVIGSYLVHAGTHLLRYFGLYYGGGEPLPTRPQALELRDGLQLLAPAFGMLLFLPT